MSFPALKCVRPKWILTPIQASELLNKLSLFPRTIVGIVLMSGIRRKLPHATWLTFRRTHCSWAHDKNVPEKSSRN